MAAPSERRIAASQGIRYRGSGCRDHRCSLLTLPCILILPDQRLLCNTDRTQSMRRQSIQGATHKPSHHTRQSDNLWIGLDVNQFKAEPATMIHGWREASPFAANIEESILSSIPIISGTCTCHKGTLVSRGYVLCRLDSFLRHARTETGAKHFGGSAQCPAKSQLPLVQLDPGLILIH
jgi:hypothetical protein